jgi:hypothetical protein
MLNANGCDVGVGYDGLRDPTTGLFIDWNFIEPKSSYTAGQNVVGSLLNAIVRMLDLVDLRC